MIPESHVRLVEVLQGAGAPVTGASGSGPGDVRLSFAPGTTPAQIVAALAFARATFNWSPAAHATWLTGQRRTAATANLDEPSEQGKLLRALAFVMLDGFNAIRARLVPPLPAITAAQLKDAIRQTIASGVVD